jgi:hypothetical protein
LRHQAENYLPKSHKYLQWKNPHGILSSGLSPCH